jgi:hypothetical protein
VPCLGDFAYICGKFLSLFQDFSHDIVAESFSLYLDRIDIVFLPSHYTFLDLPSDTRVSTRELFHDALCIDYAGYVLLSQDLPQASAFSVRSRRPYTEATIRCQNGKNNPMLLALAHHKMYIA